MKVEISCRVRPDGAWMALGGSRNFDHRRATKLITLTAVVQPVPCGDGFVIGMPVGLTAEGEYMGGGHAGETFDLLLETPRPAHFWLTAEVPDDAPEGYVAVAEVRREE